MSFPFFPFSRVTTTIALPTLLPRHCTRNLVTRAHDSDPTLRSILTRGHLAAPNAQEETAPSSAIFADTRKHGPPLPASSPYVEFELDLVKSQDLLVQSATAFSHYELEHLRNRIAKSIKLNEV